MRHRRSLLWAAALILIPMAASIAGAFTLVNIDVPGAAATYPLGMNAHGQIVGYYWDGDSYHGFLLDKGVFTAIDFPGATGTYPSGINARGQIVGYYHVQDGDVIHVHGFLLDKGVFSAIDVVGAQLTYVNGINDRGQIVGQYWDAGGTQRGFLATL